MWDPDKTAGASGSEPSRRARMFPTPSTDTFSPMDAKIDKRYSLAILSSGEYENLVTPSPGVLLNLPRSSSSFISRFLSTEKGMGIPPVRPFIYLKTFHIIQDRRKEKKSVVSKVKKPAPLQRGRFLYCCLHF